MTSGIAVACVAALALGSPRPGSAAAAPPPAAEAPKPRSHPRGHAMVAAGVGLVVASALGYVTMGAGLGVANTAEAELPALRGRDDVDRRREALRRGRLGNRLAIGAGVAAVAAMAVGIPLVVVGRRRAMAATELRVGFVPFAAGAGGWVSGKF